jgi:DNA-binding MarR family transcriptional regulator
MNKLNNKIKDNFTIIPNEIIRNKSLSDRARFIFCYMASMPDDWKFYQSAMAKELGYTKDTLRKYIEELLETGYLNREQRRETGKFDSYDYTLNFTPSGKNTDTVKNRHGKKPTRENSTLINKDFKEKKIITNIDFKEYPENSKEFSPIEINGIEIKEKKNGKVNPFQLISELQNIEKEKNCPKKEKAEPTERKPNPTYEAFTVFCQTFERLSGANYPKDKNGYYIMNPKDAGGMVYLMKNIEKVDRTDNSIEALKVFVTAAWNLNDKWIRANFTPNTLYGQFSKIFTGYQTSSPEMIEKKKNDRIAELLAEKMKQYENQ